MDTVSLGSICTIRTGKKDVNQSNPSGLYPFFTCAKEHTYSDVYSFDGKAILIAGNGVVGQTTRYEGKFEAYQRTYVLMNFNDQYDWTYLYHCIKSGFQKLAEASKLGNSMPYIKKGTVENFKIPVASLEEQRRIVAKLDAAFEKIDQAAHLTKQNLENAKNLMYASAHGSLSSTQGENKVVGDILSLEYGKPLDKADRNQGGKFAAYGANGIKDRTNKYYWDQPSIIVGRKGSAGELTRADAPFWPLDVTYYVVHDPNETDLSYLYSLLKSLNLPSFARGVKPGINRNDIYSIDITLPTLEEQIKIAKKIDTINSRMEDIIESYRHKLNLLRDLKQSMMSEAFSESAVK